MLNYNEGEKICIKDDGETIDLKFMIIYISRFSNLVDVAYNYDLTDNFHY